MINLTEGLEAFVRESNAIEGITRDPTSDELYAHDTFLARAVVDLTTICSLQSVIAPGKFIRDDIGMNVRVGGHVPPPGGPEIPRKLSIILHVVSNNSRNPWKCHIEFEGLHPFMDGNGRTGRALWAWHMRKLGRDPFALSFLHRFYYQTLENVDR
jgi:hypothetical protein